MSELPGTRWFVARLKVEALKPIVIGVWTEELSSYVVERVKCYILELTLNFKP